MNRAHKTPVLFLLLAWAVPVISTAQTTVYLSQPTRVGARALSFAGAMAGDNPDISVIYVNPAALAFIGNSYILATHSYEGETNINDENIASPLILRRGEVVGIGLSVNHVGYLSKTDKNDFKVIQYGYDVSYSRRLKPTLSVGGTLNVRYAKSPASKLWGLSSSFGIFYFPTPDISYGFSLTGLGSGIKYIYDGVTTLLNSENIPRSIHAGATMRYPAQVSRSQIFTLTVDAEKTIEHSGIRYYGGFELMATKFLALRVGYLGASQGTEWSAFGVGFKFDAWKLDFGTTPSKRAGQLYQATVSIPIWNQLDEIY